MKTLKFLILSLIILTISGLKGQIDSSSPATTAQIMEVVSTLSAEDRQKLMDYASALKQLSATKPKVKLQRKGFAPPAPPVSMTSPEVQTSASYPNIPSPRRPGYIERAETMKATKVEWESDQYDFEKVKIGEIVRHTFVFKNVGEHPLKIQKVKASCGCTTPSWSQEEIAPGGKGEISIEFNTKGKKGLQTKTVTVTGNFEATVIKILKISGKVEEN